MEAAVSGLEGVTSAEVSLAENKVTVEFNEGEVSLETIKAAIEDAGYDV